MIVLVAAGAGARADEAELAEKLRADLEALHTVRSADEIFSSPAHLMAMPRIATAGGPPPPSPTNSLDDNTIDWEIVYRGAVRSVVYLSAPGKGMATGFLVREGGAIVTARHVVTGLLGSDTSSELLSVLRCDLGESGAIRTLANERTRARVVATDLDRDLALLQVIMDDEQGRTMAALPPLPLRKPEDALNRTEEVVLIGNSADGLLWAVKHGRVQQIGRYGDRAEVLAKVDELLLSYAGGAALSGEERLRITQRIVPLAETLVIQASAEAAQGDSGGPLLDGQGRVVGVCTRYYRRADEQTPRYFYIHVTELQAFLAEHPK
ncbi:MAG: trypsin-like peptidase domain-containing protein [Candidatus Hydrogenedentes bacterium]|nr:trypsin-like peptidase domain-containing protein [Candidatus Hydrogenedentota bacterium]